MSDLAPAQNPVLTGHEEGIRQVTVAFTGSRMPHAWLLTGIEGIGKATLAYHIATHVLSGGQIPIGKIDTKHPAAKLVMAEAHPDLLVVRRTANDKGDLRETIAVDEARKIGGFLHMTAAHNGWRVVIIDEAHTLNRAGQNAILKILEEPPPSALIVMTATSPGMLLPTIRSRCRHLSLAPLNDIEMVTILTRFASELGDGELKYLITLAGGSAGFALKAIRAEALPLYEEMLAILGSLPDLEVARVHKLADRIGRKADAESFDVVVTLLVELLRRAARARATGEKGSTDMGALKGMPLDRALRIWDHTRATFALADQSNLDKKLAFIKAVSDIRQAVA
jgi:DNA polymerase-3 subunit delta'